MSGRAGSGYAGKGRARMKRAGRRASFAVPTHVRLRRLAKNQKNRLR